ncbi:hypothetical protein MASR2M54_25630 [Aliarcobacter cryaerophilus]
MIPIYPKDRVDKIASIVKSSIKIDTIENKIDFNQSNISTSYLLSDPIIYIIFTSGITGETKRGSKLQNSVWILKSG